MPRGANPRPTGRARPKRRASVVGVLGELLITIGALTLMYVVWQLWVGDWIYAAERSAEAKSLSQQWQQEYEEQVAASPSPPAPAETPAEPAPVTADPVILPQPDDAQIFGTMYIPRFGADYGVAIAGGISRARTLDPIGIGHYPGTPMPGEVGNFAVAAHRTTWGKPFNRIAELRVGDAIVVETPGGWYTYRFRTLEYVQPDAVDVLLPVPQAPGAEPGERYLTMTSCSPMFSMTERIVAYSVFDAFTPRSAGPPAALTEGVA
ncbi:class E sortase [Microbacterium ulmi]|uniref:Class E sortase n=1 Tax=Microbacterium ulmi TaxID=179095 RepID=A0A7Y2M1R6_9MICO|nr:class E sortase [Microbacterium ulmi]